MKIIKGYPPNFRAILAKFPDARKPGVIITYGDTVYLPGGGGLSPHLHAHEAVHSSRQIAAGAVQWWNSYLADLEFRLAEEVAAHRAEWHYVTQHFAITGMRDNALKTIVERLSGPLYGRMISAEKARALVTA